MMKRAHHNYGVIGEGNKTKIQHQILLKGFLELQKEFLSRKRKLQSAKQKRENLSAEVRFLKRRHEYLLRNHSSNIDQESAHVHRQMMDTERCMETERNSTDATKVASNNSSLPPILSLDTRNEERQERGASELETEEEVGRNILDNYLNESESLSKKIPCHGQSESKGLNLNVLCS